MRSHAFTNGPQSLRSLRRIAEQALSRTSGAPLLERNHVRILSDAGQNYPAWLDAIRSARRYIHLENYIFEEDSVGHEFADALIAKAKEGVSVRVVRDWLGCWGCASKGFWRRLGAAGVEVRCFNPPRLDSPLGWIMRDHRKTIAVDGRVAFVSGLCISERWLGDPRRGLAPWRDTGLEIHGPAVADVHAAFAQLWETMGASLPSAEVPAAADIVGAGDIALRVVAGTPMTAGMLRTDQWLAAVARESLWLTDAYFVGITPYVQALLAAARDGVDVRLLVPHASDLPVIGTVSRAGFRALLEGGIRIFEWNGSMLHAKTAVVDGRWSRVGSSNLNVASFVGNYELDVAIDNRAVAQSMRAMYLDDLDNATEIVLSHNRVRLLPTAQAVARMRGGRTRRRFLRGVRGQKGSAAAAIRLANAVGAAMTNRRVLGHAEGGLLLWAGVLLLVVAGLGLLWPAMLGIPVVVVAAYVGAILLWRAAVLRSRAWSAGRPALPARRGGLPARQARRHSLPGMWAKRWPRPWMPPGSRGAGT